MNLDFQIISLFRQRLLAVPLFKYCFVALAKSRYGDSATFAATLQDLGVPLSPVVIVDEMSKVEVRGAKKFVFTLDALCSPEFSAKVLIPNRLNFVIPRVQFLEALLHFQETSEAYTQESFRNLTDYLWQSKMQKCVLSRHF